MEVTTFCPRCTAEYRQEFTRCSDCGVGLVDHLVDVHVSEIRVSRDSIVQFVLLTYGITWVGTALGQALGVVPTGLRFFVSGAFTLLGSFAPSVAALGITASREGTPGVLALLGRLFDFRVAVRWYVFPLLYPAAILLAADVAHRAITGAWIPLIHRQWFAIVFAIIVTLPVRASEEIGWRGYALHRLTRKFGLEKASLILGPIWACWHLPMFLIPGMPSYGQSLPIFALAVTALSVAFAWLYANTNGRLVPVILMHSVFNEILIFLPQPRTVANPLAFPSELMPWLITAFEWLTAAYFLARMPRELSDETKSESIA